MTALITELGYLGFEVSDLPRWERFAQGVLGLDVQPGPDGSRLLRMDEARHRFILTEGPADDYAFAGWQAADAGAVEAFGRHLDGLGITWAWGTDADLTLRGVERLLHFQDPEGNRHEVYCGMRAAGTAFVSKVVKSGFVTGSGGLGHVVFGADNFPGMMEFAVKVLGLRLSDHIHAEMGPGKKFPIAFFHANERHHSFAVAPRPPIPGLPRKRFHHFMIEAHSVTEVGLARDRFLASGQPVVMDIGQHPNDQMISFYGTTPSGFHVEFGFGGVIVDDAQWQVETYDRMSDWGHRPAAPQPAPAGAATH